MNTILSSSNQKSDSKKPLSSYHEVQVGRTIYRVTSVYKGDIDFSKALEDLTVSRALQSMSPTTTRSE